LFVGHPDVADARFQTFCQAGHLKAALNARVGIGDRARTSFWLWVQCVGLELDLGRLSDVAEALRTPPPCRSPRETARIHFLRGQLAEAQWQLDDAVACYAQAIHFDQRDGWLHQEMSRVYLLVLDVEQAWQHLAESLRPNRGAALLHGQSTKVSQSHLGQIIDEFRLDDFALAELRGLRKLPPERRLVSLSDMVRRLPDHTPSAIELLVALREVGYLQKRMMQEDDATGQWIIPRRIVQFWDKIEPPPDVKRMMQTWQDFHPDFEYKLFDDAAARSFLRDHYQIKVQNAYTLARYPTAKADLFRLAYLHAAGGVYVDADDSCHSSVTQVVPPDTQLVLYQDWHSALANNFIGAVPGDPVLKRALDLSVDALHRGDSDIPWLATGPGLLTRAFAQTLTDPTLPHFAFLSNCTVLDRWQIKRSIVANHRARYKATARRRARSSVRK
jgi:hypothetical protein